MGQVIEFRQQTCDKPAFGETPENKSDDDRGKSEKAGAQILFFTGVRYEYASDADEASQNPSQNPSQNHCESSQKQSRGSAKPKK